jgi:undecaprenyl-diphosphatase
VSLRARRRIVVAIAAAGFVAGAREANRGVLRPGEARFFHRLNRLPRAALPPVWTVMQCGSLAGGVGAGLLVAASGRRRLGHTMAVTAGATWLAAKAVKPFVGRGRPTTLLESARVLGREQAGLGYPSGHAAVAMALAAAASSHVAPPIRLALWTTAAGVGAARIYVGAHLPLDVAGGMALGVALGTMMGETALAGELTDRG